MSDEILADDSAGATDAESVQDGEVNAAPDETGSEATTHASEGEELEVYDFGDFQASQSEISSWREAHEAQESKNKDYTQKTQALSADRKALADDRQKIEQDIKFYSELSEHLDGLMLGDFKNVDLDKLLDDNPDQYTRTKHEIEKRQKWKDDIHAKINAKRDQETQKALSQLHKDMDWAGNEAKFKEDSAAILSYAKEAGISNKSFSEISDPKIMSALLEAAKYRELKAKNPAVSKQVKKAPTVASPKGKQSGVVKSLAQRMYPNMN